MSFHRKTDGEFRASPLPVAHLVVGLGFLGVFLATGLYMRRSFPGAFHGDEGMRWMFRATHVYLLFASLLNVLAAAVPRPAEPPGRRRLAAAGSVMLLLGPPLLAAAFVWEPGVDRLGRPLTLAAAVLSLAGVGAVAGAFFAPRRSRVPDRNPPSAGA